MDGDTVERGAAAGEPAPAAPSPAAARLFAGPGEMRARFRAHDWVATPFGPVEQWPEALRVLVPVVLAAGLPSALLWGSELRFLYNDAYIPLIGAQHPGVLGCRLFDAAPETRQDFAPRLARVLAGETVAVVDAPTTFRRHGPDAPATTSTYTFSFAPVRDPAHPTGPVLGVHVLVVETTAQATLRAAEADAQQTAVGDAERLTAERTAERDVLRRQILDVEEAERRRLARELHDEVGQHLTALGLGLQALSDIAPPGSEIDRRAAELRGLASTMGRDLHGVAVRLRPRALDDFGLEAALSARAEEWARQTEIALAMHAHAGAERLPGAVESALYRTVQEALTNVARHSGANHASVVLERRGGHVLAIVEDDGRGFDPAVLEAPAGEGPLRPAAGGLGLLGIRERVTLLGGTLEIETAEGAGTTLYVRIPIA